MNDRADRQLAQGREWCRGLPGLERSVSAGQAKSAIAMKQTLFAFVVFLSALCLGDSSGVRSKRNILFRPGNGQLIIGFGVPVPLQNHAVTLGVVIKYNYPLPTNATELLSTYVVSARDQEAKKYIPMRWSVYEGIEAAINKIGPGLDGHQCLLRMICESATVPFDHHSGLAAELIHILLTPSSSNEIQESQPERDYAAAERSGREGMKGCAPLQKSCRVSFLDLFTRLSVII